MHRADDVAAGLAERATPLEHDGLAVPTDVGDQFDPVGAVYQHAAIGFLRQGCEVAHIGHTQRVTHITGSALKQGL